MNDYIQYIEIDENNNIKNAFTSAQEENYKEANKINIGTGLRQFNFSKHFPQGITDMESGKKNYKWNPDKKKIEEIPEEEKYNLEEEKEKKLQELQEKYILKIEEAIKIEKYRYLSEKRPEIAAFFEEYDTKKEEIEKKRAIKTLKEVEI